MARALVDKTGKKYGRLLVVAAAPSIMEPSGRLKPRWLCRCDCGAECIVRGTDMQSGRTRSCGCLFRDIAPTIRLDHAAAKKGQVFPEYKIWAGIIKRCENANSPAYRHYGGRGISVCQSWRKDFGAFLSYMGPRPSPSHSIDRYPNNDGDYEPGNCRWATTGEQARNRRGNLWVDVGGERKLLVDACSDRGMDYYKVRQRIYIYGWDSNRALSTPFPQNRKNST